jgi:hypothetical protein
MTLGILHWSYVWACVGSLTQMHPKLQIEVLQSLKLKATRPKKSTEGDSDSNHTLISQYLRCPKPQYLKFMCDQD